MHWRLRMWGAHDPRAGWQRPGVWVPGACARVRVQTYPPPTPHHHLHVGPPPQPTADMTFLKHDSDLIALVLKPAGRLPSAL